MANTNNKTPSKKPKLVRDSFTIPKAEFVLIEDMKSRAIALGTSVKKSELLRAGLKLLQGLNDNAYKAALAAVPTLKTGRPSSEAPTAAAVKPVEKTTVRKKAATTPEAKVAVSKPATKPAVTPVASKAKAAAKSQPASAPRKALVKATAPVKKAAVQAATPTKAPKPEAKTVSAPVQAPAPAPIAAPVETLKSVQESVAKV